MLQLELSDQEQELLVEVLRTSLTELRTKVAHTDRFAHREQLKVREQSIKQIVRRLDQS